MEAGKRVKMEGLDNDLLKRIQNDPIFNLNQSDMNKLLDAKDYVGRSPEQVLAFIKSEVDPIRLKHIQSLGRDVSLKV